MTNAEYLAMQQRVELLSRLLLDTDADALRDFIAAANRADTLGPFLDPTSWSRGHESLAMVREHAAVLAEARSRIEKAARRAGAIA